MSLRDTLEQRLEYLAKLLGTQYVKVGTGNPNCIVLDGVDRKYRIEKVCSDGKGVDLPFGSMRQTIKDLTQTVEFAIAALELRKNLAFVDGEADIHVWAKGQSDTTSALFTLSYVSGPSICHDMPKEQALEHLGDALDQLAEETKEDEDEDEDGPEIVVSFKNAPSDEIVKQLNDFMKASGKMEPSNTIVYTISDETEGYVICSDLERHKVFGPLIEDVFVDED